MCASRSGFFTTQLGVDAVTTFIAELKFVESEATPVTEVRMGLGYDGLIFSGRGMARVTPIGFGLDIFLGGVSDRGIMLGIDVFLPVPIPLGPSGLGLNGIGGDYAHNFKPRLESGLEAEGPILDLETGDTPPEEPVEAVQNPTAIHYIQWARNPGRSARPLGRGAAGRDRNRHWGARLRQRRGLVRRTCCRSGPRASRSSRPAR